MPPDDRMRFGQRHRNVPPQIKHLALTMGGPIQRILNYPQPLDNKLSTMRVTKQIGRTVYPAGSRADDAPHADRCLFEPIDAERWTVTHLLQMPRRPGRVDIFLRQQWPRCERSP